VECHVRDGLEHLRIAPQRYDAIVLDAYDGDAIPEQLKSDEFFGCVRAALGDTGIFLANVHVLDDADPGAARFGQAIAPYFPRVTLLDRPGEENRNTIVVAGPGLALRTPGMEFAPHRGADEIAAALAALTFHTV
jgi:spermidine synthase